MSGGAASRGAWIGVVGAVIALWSRPLQADVFSTFGAGARAAGMAGGGTALADDFTALFACPALMAFGPSSLGVGFVGGVNRLGVRLSARPARSAGARRSRWRASRGPSSTRSSRTCV